MDLSFFPLTLEAVDAAAAESLCLFIASDERPLLGLSGLADWRLSGRLSRLLRSGLLTGEAGEAVLTPPGARLGFQKLFLFGVGPAAQTEEKLAEQITSGLRKLAQAGVQEAALQLPARLSAEAGVRVLLEEPRGPRRAIVFGPEPQRLVAALAKVARRASAPPPLPEGSPPAVKPAQRAPSAPGIPIASPTPQPAVPAPPVPPAASEERRPTPPPPQRYVPPPPKPSVFEKNKGRKK